MCHFENWHKTPWIHPDLVPYYIRGWAILYTNSHTPNIMKLFVTKFYQTLILNVATIAAIVVGIVQFAVRAYKENNGPEKVRRVMQNVLKFVDTIVGNLQYQLNTGVPVEKVAQRRTKRSWILLFYIRTWDTNPMFDELWSEIAGTLERDCWCPRWDLWPTRTSWTWRRKVQSKWLPQLQHWLLKWLLQLWTLLVTL